MCPEHIWTHIFGVHKIDAFRFVLDGYICFNCDTIISENEYKRIKLGPIQEVDGY